MPSIKPNRSTLQKFNSFFGGSSEDNVKMPGKSNKFDFTNRSNSGAKLGEIIGGMLEKEAEKVKKDAERHAAKARKQSSDSSGGVYEQQSTTHIIDLKAPSKGLGDDGVCAMADGMEIALRSGTNLASLALEDLNLSSNGITTVALARLAPIIKLAKYDLKTINLASNKIQVATDEQAQQWETFLLAFKDCMRMRRLDLSDNEQLGSRAMEIFARVHVNERQITPNRPGGNASVLSLVSEDGEDDDSRSDHSGQVDSVTDGGASIKPKGMTDAGILQRRCGLRSTPYITLHNIGLTDAGALWLSYTLEDHFYPSQLISELNATNAESIIKAYQQNTHSRGIDWTENKLLGKEGTQLLQKTEAIREHTLHDDSANATELLEADTDAVVEGEGSRRHGGSSDNFVPRAKPSQRRGSFRSIRTTDGGEHEASELESARKKIMRHILGHDTSHCADLWQSSIAVFLASRLIRYISPDMRKYHTGEPLFATAEIPATPTVQPPTPLASPAQENNPGLRIDTEKAKGTSQSLRATYASKLQSTTNGSGEPELVITDVTNTPTTPLRLQKPTHRKGAFSEGTDVESVSTKLNALIVRDNSPLRFVKFQQRRIDAAAAEGKIYRDRRTPSHLPADVMKHLVGSVVTASTGKASDVHVCRGEQRRRAIQRGQDKSTLKAETEWLKKDRSAQVLMLLDSIQCLHYGQ